MPHETTIYTKTRDGYILEIETILTDRFAMFLSGKEISTLPKVFYRLNISDACDLLTILKDHGPAGFVNACHEYGLPFLNLQKRLIK